MRPQNNIVKKICKVLIVKRDELPPLIYAFCYYFCLLCSYYILRPFRDEMSIIGGVNNLQWLFTATFFTMLGIVPLFGFITKKLSREKLIPYVYYFFLFNIIVFYSLFLLGINPQILAMVFFVWLSVFNLFVVSVFWSLMADVFTTGQSKRLFGIIAAGGSAGAISGPAITAFLAQPLGPANLLPISAALLFAASIFAQLLIKVKGNNSFPIKIDKHDKFISGNIFSGITAIIKSNFLLKISLLIILYTAVSTFLYFEQAHIVENEISTSAVRTSLFGFIDLTTNTLAVTSQFFLTSRVLKKYGLVFLLAFVPFLVMMGFVSLSLLTFLPVVILIQVIHRAGNFAFQRPGREMLFTFVNKDEKYKAKNFIDTVVYRGGDALTGWLFALLLALQLSLSVIALIAVPIIFLWMMTGRQLGNNKLLLEKNNL